MTDQAAGAASTSETSSRKPGARGPAPDTTKKRAFVLSQSPNATAADVAKAARKAGLTMSEKFVYRIRREDKKGSGSKKSAAPKKKAKVQAAAPKKKAPSKAASAPAAHGGSGSRALDQTILSLALEHGLGNIIDAIERLRVRASKGGVAL